MPDLLRASFVDPAAQLYEVAQFGGAMQGPHPDDNHSVDGGGSPAAGSAQ